jgi:hypothetical protein
MTGDRTRRARRAGNDAATAGSNASTTTTRSDASGAARVDADTPGSVGAREPNVTDRKPASRKRRKPFVL